MKNIEEELTKYPIWLRELIFPTDPYFCKSRQDFTDYERATKQIFELRRTEPICMVLFEVMLENIRFKFRLKEMEQHIEQHIMELEDRLTLLGDK